MNKPLSSRLTVEQAAAHLLRMFKDNAGQARLEAQKRSSFSKDEVVKQFYSDVRDAIKVKHERSNP